MFYQFGVLFSVFYVCFMCLLYVMYTYDILFKCCFYIICLLCVVFSLYICFWEVCTLYVCLTCCVYSTLCAVLKIGLGCRPDTGTAGGVSQLWHIALQR